MKTFLPISGLLGIVAFLLPLLCFLSFPIRAQGVFQTPQAGAKAFGIDLDVSAADFFIPTLTDIDRDGDLDLFISANTYTNNPSAPCAVPVDLLFYENISTGLTPVFPSPVSLPFGISASISRPEFVDIDADGDLDIFGSSWCEGGRIMFMENKGTPNTPDFGNSPLQPDPFGITTAALSSPKPVFADMDGDGDFDAFLNGDGVDHFLYLQNTGTPRSPEFTLQTDPFGLVFPASYAYPSTIDILDWDCDGDQDLLIAFGSEESELYSYENTSSNPAQPAFASGLKLEDQVIPMTHGDMDGDGDLDVMSWQYYYQNISQESACTQKVFSADSLIFRSQSAIESFLMFYPECVQINSVVSIRGDDISDLSGLQNIQQINGDLILDGNINLHDLSGLEHLRFVHGDLRIGEPKVFGLLESDANALDRLAGLDNLLCVSGDFQLWGNLQLGSLGSLEKLSLVGGDLSLSLNPLLQDLSGLEALRLIRGTLNISLNNSSNWSDGAHLKNLNGLDNLVSVGEDLFIGLHPFFRPYNSSLKSLDGLHALTSVGGNFTLIALGGITTLDALENLESIGGSLFIGHCFGLQDLDGLQHLEAVHGNLSLIMTGLKSLYGIQNIHPESLSGLQILGNQGLTHCAIESVCQYIQITPADIAISDNAPGCDSAKEVESACLVLSTEDFPTHTAVRIYPNPASDKLTIETEPVYVLEKVSIYDVSGRLIHHVRLYENYIDVSRFDPGMYFLRFTIGGRECVERVVVK